MSGSDDSGLTAFLNRLDDGGEYPLADPSNPLQWGKFGQALVGSIVGTLAIGFTDIFESIGDAWNSLLDGGIEFIAGTEKELHGGLVTIGEQGLLDVVVDPLVMAATTAWNINVEQFGLLALPVAVGVTMGAFLVVMRAVAFLNGGEGL